MFNSGFSCYINIDDLLSIIQCYLFLVSHYMCLQKVEVHWNCYNSQCNTKMFVIYKHKFLYLANNDSLFITDNAKVDYRVQNSILDEFLLWLYLIIKEFWRKYSASSSLTQTRVKYIIGTSKLGLYICVCMYETMIDMRFNLYTRRRRINLTWYPMLSCCHAL